MRLIVKVAMTSNMEKTKDGKDLEVWLRVKHTPGVGSWVQSLVPDVGELEYREASGKLRFSGSRTQMQNKLAVLGWS